MAITLPQDAMAQLFAASPDNDLPQGPNFNVCPTMPIAVATSDAGHRRLRAMRWGFIPRWYKAPTDGASTVSNAPAAGVYVVSFSAERLNDVARTDAAGSFSVVVPDPAGPDDHIRANALCAVQVAEGILERHDA